MQTEQIKQLNAQAHGLDAPGIIKLAESRFGSRVSFATSLGEEDQVITDMIASLTPGVEIFTLDTGRLFAETYELMAQNQKKYSRLNFRIYYPDTKSVEEMVRSKGINLFYESVENRKLCCHVRKVEPLQRALAGKDAWIVGLRRDQAVTRSALEPVEWDGANQKIKFNPLYNWSLQQVRDYVKQHHVDVNPLHAQGFVSIGCAPCTRAVKPGEDLRAGRWWWETPEGKECGLHNNPKWKGATK
ncbi:MAG: phosphoadenylyl-sulfate reductase [Candidatus Omnitrophica bacterium]|nr:phosphoadenylyl-sulfate reductase [Candidatus Omnitrophota bacterium]MDE2214445.1 phosphoadenylyl-sulfate reductase [Candidatus Omnitrophota bacterium]MDE2231585.1 phosphoadenylyl-sulfate reductase [Candidatus Omnitrophota bacterium]